MRVGHPPLHRRDCGRRSVRGGFGTWTRLRACYGNPVLKSKTPWGVHALTVIHGLGALACLVMAIGCVLSESLRLGLVASPGSVLVMDLFGKNVWLFLIVIAALLSTLCYGSWRLRRWTWPLTLICYSIGVMGGLWEVAMGIPAGFLAAAINGAIVGYACTSRVRAAYSG